MRASSKRFNKRNKSEKTQRVNCRNKQNTFPNEEGAKAGAGHLVQYINVLLRPYQCPRCKQWHLTKQESTKSTVEQGTPVHRE